MVVVVVLVLVSAWLLRAVFAKVDRREILWVEEFLVVLVGG